MLGLAASPAGAAIILTGANSPNSTGGADPWSVGSDLIIGASATGGMTVNGGSDVSNSGGSLAGGTADSVGTVTVDGAGSTWTGNGTLVVGSNGSGMLNIQNGGTVSNSGCTIGNTAAAVGTVTVDGVGSMWSNGGGLAVGSLGKGTLNINNSGLVIATGLNGGNVNSSVNFDGGTLRVLNTDSATNIITLGAGGGTLDILTAANTFTINSGISGAGGLSKTAAGTLALTAANTYQGNTLVSEGKLTLSGAGSFASSPTITVQNGTTLVVSNVTSGLNHDGTRFTLASGQTLKGNGTVTGAMDIAAGATIAPGESIGTLSTASLFLTDINSDFNPEIDLGPTLAADLLNVTGTVSLNNSTLDLSLLNPSLIGLPKTFLLVNNDGGLLDPVVGVFGTVHVPAGYLAVANTAFLGIDALGRVGDGNDIAVTISTLVPEPASLTLLAVIAVTFALAAFRRRRVAL